MRSTTFVGALCVWTLKWLEPGCEGCSLAVTQWKEHAGQANCVINRPTLLSTHNVAVDWTRFTCFLS